MDPWWTWPLFKLGCFSSGTDAKAAMESFLARSRSLDPAHPWRVRATQTLELIGTHNALDQHWTDPGGVAPITLTVMAKDEAPVLPRLISSISSINPSRRILVDRGSSDSTVSIARDAGFEVISRPWDGDYAAGRNAALDMIASGWVCYFDPDELLEAGSVPRIRKIALADTGSDFHCFRLRQGPASIMQLRMWKADPFIRFRPAIHERIWPECEPTYHHDIVFDHLDDPTVRESKRAERFERLLEMKAQYPTASYWDFHMSISLVMQGDHVGAKRHALAYLSRREGEWDRSIMYMHYTTAWCDVWSEDKDLDAAVRTCIRCLSECQGSAEFWCLLGDAFILGGRPMGALSFYELAKDLGTFDKLNPWLVDCDKYGKYPDERIAQIRSKMGDEAISKAMAEEQARELGWLKINDQDASRSRQSTTTLSP